jgi:hypothetical protein
MTMKSAFIQAGYASRCFVREGRSAAGGLRVRVPLRRRRIHAGAVRRGAIAVKRQRSASLDTREVPPIEFRPFSSGKALKMQGSVVRWISAMVAERTSNGCRMSTEQKGGRKDELVEALCGYCFVCARFRFERGDFRFKSSNRSRRFNSRSLGWPSKLNYTPDAWS